MNGWCKCSSGMSVFSKFGLHALSQRQTTPMVSSPWLRDKLDDSKFNKDSPQLVLLDPRSPNVEATQSPRNQTPCHRLTVHHSLKMRSMGFVSLVNVMEHLGGEDNHHALIQAS